jgi:hypothetical protein
MSESSSIRVYNQKFGESKSLQDEITQQLHEKSEESEGLTVKDEPMPNILISSRTPPSITLSETFDDLKPKPSPNCVIRKCKSDLIISL